MNKIKWLATAALVAGIFAASAPAEARYVKSHTETTMQNEYGFQKDMKGNKKVKNKLKALKHKQKKRIKKKHSKRHGTTPNECINPPCGHNYDR